MSNTEIINEEPIIDSQPTTSEEEKILWQNNGSR